MGFILEPGQPDPELTRVALLERIATQALRLNDRLLAERRRPRKRKEAA